MTKTAWLLDTLISHLLIDSATTQSEIQTLNAAGEKYWMGILYTISMTNLITDQHLCMHTLYSLCTTLSANHCFVWLETPRQSIWFAKFWPHPDWVHFLVFWSGNLIFVGNHLCPDSTRFRWVVWSPPWHSDQWGTGLVIAKAKARQRYWKTSLFVRTMDWFPLRPPKSIWSTRWRCNGQSPPPWHADLETRWSACNRFLIGDVRNNFCSPPSDYAESDATW